MAEVSRKLETRSNVLAGRYSGCPLSYIRKTLDGRRRDYSRASGYAVALIPGQLLCVRRVSAFHAAAQTYYNTPRRVRPVDGGRRELPAKPALRGICAVRQVPMRHRCLLAEHLAKLTSHFRIQELRNPVLHQ